MTQFCLGKLDPEPISGLGWISDYETEKLPVLPSVVAVPNVTLEMDGNGPDPSVTNQGPNFQGVGNCTIVGARNLDAFFNAEVKESDPIPNANSCVSTYFACSGGVDSGLAETSVLNTWRTKGLFHYKIDAFAPVDHSNITAIEQAIAFYGACYFGVQLPESAQQQFNVGGTSTWSVVNGSPIAGGHCIAAGGYNQAAQTVEIATWGQWVTVEYDWLAEYLDEAYAVIGKQFVQAGKGPSLDLAALKADLPDL